MNEEPMDAVPERSGTPRPPRLDPSRARCTWTLGSMAVGLLILGATWLGARDALVARNWGIVEEPVVYRSGRLSRHLVRAKLERHGIRRIVDLTEIDPANPDEAAEQAAADELGVEVLRLPLSGDGRGDIAHYADAIGAIKHAVDAGLPLLVHCAAGAQRTGGVVACYRLLVQERGPDAVRAEMIRHGWDPNRDRVLTEFLNEKMGQLAEELVDRGIIPRIPDPLPRL